MVVISLAFYQITLSKEKYQLVNVTEEIIKSADIAKEKEEKTIISNLIEKIKDITKPVNETPEEIRSEEKEEKPYIEPEVIERFEGQEIVDVFVIVKYDLSSGNESRIMSEVNTRKERVLSLLGKDDLIFYDNIPSSASIRLSITRKGFEKIKNSQDILIMKIEKPITTS